MDNNLLNNLLQTHQISYGKSYEEIFNDVTTYLRSVNPRWTNMAEDDIGLLIIHALTFLSTNTNYHLDRAVQELHPDYATEDVSKHSLSNFLGFRQTGVVASSGQIAMYLSGNKGLHNHKLVIPKYFSFTSRSSNSVNTNVVTTINESMTNLSRIESLKVKIRDFDYTDTSISHPEIYLIIHEGLIDSYEIISQGSGLNKYADSNNNIRAYADSNKLLDIILVERSGSIESVVINNDYQSATDSGEFNSSNTALLLPVIYLDVIEGTPSTQIINFNQVYNNEIDTGLRNIDISSLEVYDSNGRLWERVSNIQYEFDNYGLNPHKYSVRFSSTGNLILELSSTLDSQVSNNQPYLFKIRFIVSSPSPIDLVASSDAIPISNVQLLNGVGLDPDLSLSQIHINSKISRRVYGGRSVRSADENLLLARIQSRMMSTIVTVPDLAGAVRTYVNEGISAAADINDDDNTLSYIQSKLGKPVATYEMYYSVCNSSLDELDEYDLDKLSNYIYNYKHIFTKSFNYVPPDIVTVDLDVVINYSSSYEDSNLYSNSMEVIKELFSVSNIEFNSYPTDAEIISALYKLSSTIVEVSVSRSNSSNTFHNFSVTKLDKVSLSLVKSLSSRGGGYKYDSSKR